MKSINELVRPSFKFLAAAAVLSSACCWLSLEIVFQLITK